MNLLKLTKDEMRAHSVGIAAEMGSFQTAELIASNGLLGDGRIEVWELDNGVQAANTNGDPVWREAVESEEWDELLQEGGVYVRHD